MFPVRQTPSTGILEDTQIAWEGAGCVRALVQGTRRSKRRLSLQRSAARPSVHIGKACSNGVLPGGKTPGSARRIQTRVS